MCNNNVTATGFIVLPTDPCQDCPVVRDLLAWLDELHLQNHDKTQRLARLRAELAATERRA